MTKKKVLAVAGILGISALVMGLFLIIKVHALPVVILSVLMHWAGLNPYLAKLLTEVTLFVCSWLVQRKLIFPNREQRRNNHHETILEQ